MPTGRQPPARSDALVVAQEVVAVRAVVLAVLTVVHAERYEAATENAPEENAAAGKKPGEETGDGLDARDDLLVAVRASEARRSRSERRLTHIDVRLVRRLRPSARVRIRCAAHVRLVGRLVAAGCRIQSRVGVWSRILTRGVVRRRSHRWLVGH